MASTSVEVISSTQFEPAKTMSFPVGAPPLPIQKMRRDVFRIFVVASAIDSAGMCFGATIKTCVSAVSAEIGPCR